MESIKLAYHEKGQDLDPDERPEFQEEQLKLLDTTNEWARSGTSFHARTRADKVKVLPPGVYTYRQSMTGWWLERTSPKFEFPFKVYNASGDIINRIKRYWQRNTGNLGVLMNGLRGAGKTMTAQLLANDLIEEEGLPVLVVRNPIPLQIVFTAVQQNMVVIFDEFEKTHDNENQQQLLSTIDGMSRSSFDRLIIFTTNKTEIDANFRDRPSRIHYKFEFMRVADEIIEGLIDDSLPEDLIRFKPDIFEFLNSRAICTIDIVKAVISEVVTFRESPLEFEGMLNVAKGEPPAYTIEILHPEKNTVVNVFSHYFRLSGTNSYTTSLLAGNQRSVDKFRDNGSPYTIHSRGWDGGSRIMLLDKCEEEGCFLAKLAAPRSKTIFKGFHFLEDAQLWLDNRPEDFKFPYSPDIVAKDPEAREALEDLWYQAQEAGTQYGTGDAAVFKIRITPNRDTDASSMEAKWRPNGDVTAWD